LKRVHVILLLALVASALWLVRTSYDARQLYAAIEQSRVQERALEVEFKRLDAERRAQATHLRVERMAREKLQMRTASPAVTVYVADPSASQGSR
jgi:cell division protein FtsL